MPNMVKVQAVNPVLVFDLDAFLASTDTKLPDSIPQWIQAKIMQSAEWLDAFTDGTQSDTAPGGAVGSDAPAGEEVPF
jgi:hypothetical protein